MGRGGFTLIELAIAMSILIIGIVSLTATTVRMHSLRRQNREQLIAQNALRSMAERIHSRSYQYSSDPTTWASNVVGDFGTGGTFGDTFEVRTLDVLPGEASVGTITIVTDETSTDQDVNAPIGMPRDLNGDGDADDTNVSGGARILPVVLTMSWRSGSGRPQARRHAFYLMGY